MTLLYANVNATYIFHRIWRLFTVSHNPQTLLLHTANIAVYLGTQGNTVQQDLGLWICPLKSA